MIIWTVLKKAGYIHCAIETFSTVCPDRVSDNHAYMRLGSETSAFLGRHRGECCKSGKICCGVVTGKANVSVGVSHTKKRTIVNTYSVIKWDLHLSSLLATDIVHLAKYISKRSKI